VTIEHVAHVAHVAHGADALRAFGARLAQALLAAPGHPFLLVTLSGELGAGKTTLVGGLLAELGHSGPVRSPTYTLIEPYRLQGRDIAHCDLYRLRHPDELEDLGLRDLQGAGSVLLVEWPEKAEGRLGAADLALTLDYAGPDARSLVLEARSLAGQAVLARL
jgi:tRNA threonylcarbamoyladenosine biosynthesis protein TsaE